MKSNESNLATLIGTDINGYIITKYIASGSFGDCFEAKHSETNKKFALKIPIINKHKDGERWLIEEANIYKKLYKKGTDDTFSHLPKTKIIKNTQLNKKILVMELLGDSLDKKLDNCKEGLSLKTIILLAIQMIESIRYIHKCGYIHRDIKPDNFVMSRSGKDLYCIDFGLAKKYLKNMNKGHKFCGTGRYASIAAHKGYEQSRKDDLESVAYLLIYLFKSKLPWMGCKNKDKNERYKMMMKKKIETSEEELCEGLPKEFKIFLILVKTMDFDEEPLYNSYIKMFKKLYKSLDYKDKSFDWN